MTRGAYDSADSAWGKSLTDEIREILDGFEPELSQPTILQTEILDLTLEDMHRHLHRRLGTPRGILQDEIHTATCKAAERVTRQQRRHLERQRRKAR